MLTTSPPSQPNRFAKMAGKGFILIQLFCFQGQFCVFEHLGPNQ